MKFFSLLFASAAFVRASLNIPVTKDPDGTETKENPDVVKFGKYEDLFTKQKYFFEPIQIDLTAFYVKEKEDKFERMCKDFDELYVIKQIKESTPYPIIESKNFEVSNWNVSCRFNSNQQRFDFYTRPAPPRQIRIINENDGFVFNLDWISDPQEKAIQKEFNAKIEKLLMNTRNHLDAEIYHEDVQNLLRYVLESQEALGGFNLNRIRDASFVFYPKNTKDVLLYLKGHARVKDQARVNIFIAYVPHLSSFLTREDAKALGTLARAANCMTLIEDVIRDFPTTKYGFIDIKIMPDFTEQTLSFIEKYGNYAGFSSFLRLPSVKGKKQELQGMKDSFFTFISHGGPLGSNYGAFSCDERSSLFFNGANRRFYSIQKDDETHCKLHDFDRTRLSEITTAEQLEAYIEHELHFKFFYQHQDEFAHPLKIMLRIIFEASCATASKEAKKVQNDVFKLERNAVLSELMSLKGELGERMRFLTGLKLEDCDFFLENLWEGYFRVHSDPKVEVLKKNFLLRAVSGENKIKPELQALALCLLKNGEGLDRERISVNEMHPTLLDALFLNVEDKKLSSEVFIAAYEATFGANFDMTKRLSAKVSLANFEFTSLNAKAILYSLALINQFKKVNINLARKLLRQITPELYEQMTELADLPEFFKSLQYFPKQAHVSWFLAFNLTHVPMALMDLGFKRMCETGEILSTSENLDWLVDELLQLPNIYIRSLYVLLPFNARDDEPTMFSFFTKEKTPDIWARRNELLMKRATLYKLLSEASIIETELYNLFCTDVPFYRKLAKLRLKLSSERPFCVGCLGTEYFNPFVNLLITESVEPLYGWHSITLSETSREMMQIITTATLLFGLELPLLNVEDQLVTVQGGYAPLQKVLEAFFMENDELKSLYETINKVTYEFNAFRKNAKKEEFKKAALENIESGLPLLLEYNPFKHSAAMVIFGTTIYLCDRAMFDRSGIIKITLGKSVDDSFLEKFWDVKTHEDILTHLIDEYKLPGQRYPRLLSAQYAGNCGALSWLMGLWCVFDALKIDHSLYRNFTKVARQKSINDLIAARSSSDIDFSNILASIWLKTRPGAYDLGKFNVASLNSADRDRVLLLSKKEFFYSTFHLSSYLRGIESEDSENSQKYIEKRKKYLVPTVTNGDFLLEDIARGILDAHPYLKILALCLRKQGKGVAKYLRTLEPEMVKEIQTQALMDSYTLPAAMVLSAFRFGVKVDPAKFAVVWELNFGEDWRQLNYKLLLHQKNTTPLEIEDCFPMNAESAKGMFYLLLYCELTNSGAEGLLRRFKEGNNEFCEAFPDNRLACQVFEEKIVTLDFPFHHLRNKYYHLLQSS